MLPPARLRQSLRFFDGLAMVVGIMIGSGIFRTPGLVARQLGRPWLTFVAWLLGGVLALAGALCFAELATRHPQAGGKYVYAREAFGRRIGFVVGWCEGFAMYPAAIAALGVVTGEFIGRLAGWPYGVSKWIGVATVALLVAINMTGVTSGRWVQNVATSAKVLALSAVVVMAFAAGHGEGWHGTLAGAPTGVALFGALAIAFQSVIWSYYGYGDAAKIAEEVVDPGRTLPRVFLFGIAIATGLYLLLNAAFLHVLPFNRLATSVLVAGDVGVTIFGSHGNLAITVLALLVVLASLNGNIFVTPRVIFGLSREGLGPRVLAEVNAGGTPSEAMLSVGIVAVTLAATGTFVQLLAMAIGLVLILDSVAIAALFPLRARRPDAPFRVPLYPIVPAALILVYLALLAGTAITQPWLIVIAVGVLLAAWGLSWLVIPPAGIPAGTESHSPSRE
ncbi:MAG TPA: amino acid permease [Gemmatimonadales bacterium]|nr:amino acid permease [Gemmatimonadales bacterium]